MSATITLPADYTSEIAETTPQLRWVSRVALINHGQEIGTERVLQQAWRIYVRDVHHKVMGSRIEWKDVPLVDDFAAPSDIGRQ